MVETYLDSKSHLYSLINDQLEQLKSSKVLKLINFNNGPVSKQLLAEIIECIHEFTYSFDPPIEIEKISLASNQIDELPENISILGHNVKYLDFHHNNLTGLPISLGEFKNLEILDLSANALWNFPSNIMEKLTNLKVISLKENKFKYLPLKLGELPYLNFIEVADNPLVLPSQDLVKSFQKSHPDMYWVGELKSYLVANKSVLDQKIAEIRELKLIKPRVENPVHPDESQAIIQPTVSRSMSTSDAKSSRASRRMGLIIKKNDRSTDVSEQSESTNSSFLTTSDASVDVPSSLNYSQLISEPFQVETPLPISASIPSSQTSSPNQHPPTILQPKTTTASTTTRSTRPSTRSRSNTLKEIDNFLQKNEVDTENKSSAYFRRLSTLQELPSDEISSHDHQTNVFEHTANSRSGSRNGNLNQIATHPDLEVLRHAQSQVKEEASSGAESVAVQNRTLPSELSPSKSQTHAKRINSSSIIKVSRKVLFSFSELHSSVRRFSGFCTDKKISYKMVSYLYTTKANVDTLVENLEVMEETDNNLDQIVACLHTCITSFKAMMGLLSESFSVFVANIDVCFIRMLFLTIYAAMNELLNAYRILNANKPPQLSIPMIPQANDSKQKLSINTSASHETEEVDENLYRAIDVATSNAQVVFGELTRAITNSDFSSTNNGSSINQPVAKQVKELTGICMTSMDITKRLKTKLITIRNNPSMQTKRGFWDDINLFLKAIIQTFQSVKGIMQDLPILNEIRGCMSNLTKNTKDLTLLLEASSYKSMATESSTPSTASHPSTVPSLSSMLTPVSTHSNLQLTSKSQVNLSQMNSLQQPPVRTPLVATLGAAAQAIMPAVTSNSESNPGPNFISPITSPGIMNNGPTTAPVNSSGQFFAKSGVNPFDGLILAKKEDKVPE